MAIYFFIRSNKKQSPCYYSGSLHWYDSKYLPTSRLTLMIDDKVVSRFTITQLAFWNAGDISIRPTDFINSRNLSIRLPKSVRVFEIQITKCTNPEISASINRELEHSDSSHYYYPLDFQYLDKDDGFSLIVIHDGGEADLLDFAGKLPGVKSFRGVHRHVRGGMLEAVISPAKYNKTPPLLKWMIFPSTFFLMGTIGAVSIYHSIFKQFQWYQPFGWWMIIYYFFPLLYFLNDKPEIPQSLYSALMAGESPKAEDSI